MPRRPAKAIDPKHLQGMAENGSTDAELAAYYGIGVAALRRRYRDELEVGRATRHIRLRQWQTKVASEGNVTMLTFLGKAELRQGEPAPEADDVRVMRRKVERDKAGEAVKENTSPSSV